MDGIIELIQKYLHQMNFPATVTGYKNHSGNAMLHYRSLLFANSEYCRMKSIDDLEQKFMSEVNLVEEARVKTTQTPKRIQEYKFVEEIIDITKCTTENLSRSDVD